MQASLSPYSSSNKNYLNTSSNINSNSMIIDDTPNQENNPNGESIVNLNELAHY